MTDTTRILPSYDEVDILRRLRWEPGYRDETSARMTANVRAAITGGHEVHPELVAAVDEADQLYPEPEHPERYRVTRFTPELPEPDPETAATLERRARVRRLPVPDVLPADPLGERYAVRWDPDRPRTVRLTRKGDDVRETMLCEAAAQVIARHRLDDADPWPLDGGRRRLRRATSGERDLFTVRAWALHVDGRHVEVELGGITYRAPRGDEGAMALVGGAFLAHSDLLAATGGRHVGRSTTQGASAEIAEAVLHEGPSPLTPYRDRLGWWLRDGVATFTHARGVIGAAGPVDGGVEVGAIDPVAEHYWLPPAPADVETGRRAWEATTVVLDVVTPTRAAGPLFCAPWAAVFGDPHGCFAITGPTGAGKTGVLALIVQHHAPGTRHDRFPTPGAQADNATNFALEWMRHHVGDLLLPLDDNSSDHSAQVQTRLFQHFARTGYNRSFRLAGVRSGDRLRDPRRPRSLDVMNGEGLAGQESAENRALFVDLAPGDVDLTALAEADRDGGPELRAAATAAFVQWWAPRLVAERDRRIAAAGEALRAACPDVPVRHVNGTADAYLAAGWAWIDCAADLGWLDVDEAAGWRTLIMGDAVEALRWQVDRAEGRSLPERVQRWLDEGLRGGACHACSSTDGTSAPADPQRWGWRRRGEGAYVVWEPTGPKIGYVHPGEPGVLWALRSPTYAFLQRQLGEQFTAGESALAADLAAAGAISTTTGHRDGRLRHFYGRQLRVPPSAPSRRLWDIALVDVDEVPPTPAAPTLAPPPPDPEPLPELPLPLEDGPTPEGGGDRPASPAVAPVAHPPAPSGGDDTRRAAQRPTAPVSGRRRSPRAPAECRCPPVPVAAFVATPEGELVNAAGHHRPVTLDLPALVAEAARAARARGGDAVAQLVVPAEVMAALGLPDVEPERDGARPDVAALTAAGWVPAYGDGELRGAPWLRLRHRPAPTAGAGEPLGRADVILAGWRDADVFPGEGPPELTARRLELFADAFGLPYGPSPGVLWSGLALDEIAAHARRNRPLFHVSDEVCAAWPEGLAEAMARGTVAWTRPGRPDEGGWEHRYDANKAYMAAYGSVRLATDPLARTGPIAFDPTLAGMWLVRVGDWPHEGELPAPWGLYVDGRGDNAHDAPLWLPHPLVKLAADEGVQLDVVDSWTAPGHPLTGLRYVAGRVRDALAAMELPAPDGRGGVVLAPGADVEVYAAGKTFHRAAYGAMKSPLVRLIERTDWFAGIKAAAVAATLHRVYRVHEATGRAPVAVHEDAVTYRAADPDPVAACPPLAMRNRRALGPGLGQFHHERTAEV